MFIFSLFLTIKKKLVIQLDLASYTAIINAIQTTVTDQFIALKNNKFYLKQTKIKLCAVVGYYRFLLFDLSGILIECLVNGFFINYYKLQYYIYPIILVSCY